MGGTQGRRQGRRVQPGDPLVDLIEMADQQQPSDLQIPRMRRIHPIPVRFERCPRRVEGFFRPAQITSRQGNFRFGHHTARPGHGLFRTKCPPRPFDQRLRALQITELRHGDAAQCQRRRVVAQRNPVQRPEGVPRRQRSGGGGDQRIHLRRATMVTPNV
ncbi:hypothetical protein D3C84_885340 [compost metagenome]